MYRPSEREQIRAGVIAKAREDARISGGALTGSAAANSDAPSSGDARAH